MKPISVVFSAAFGLLFLLVPVEGATLVVPNGGFEEEGDVLDGDGDLIPVAQDPGDLVATVPGWSAARGGVFNPAGSRFPAWLTTTAHSGSLALLMDDDDNFVVPLRSENGSILGVNAGDTITISGWMADPARRGHDIVVSVGILTPIVGSGDFFADWQPGLGGVPGAPETLAFGGNPAASPEWLPWSVSLTLGPEAALLQGQPVALSIRGTEDRELLVDDISAVLVSVPEPSVILFAAMSLVSLVSLVQRRRWA